MGFCHGHCYRGLLVLVRNLFGMLRYCVVATFMKEFLAPLHFSYLPFLLLIVKNHSEIIKRVRDVFRNIKE